MKRAHPFRFKRVARKDTRVYRVVYDHDPSRPRSTGIAVHPRDTKNGGPGYEEAVAWAYAHLDDEPASALTFKEATVDMFTEACAWRRKLMKKGRTFSSGYFEQHRGRLVNYIWPRWGSHSPNKIYASNVDDWLLDLDVIGSARPASPGQCDKIIQTFRHAMDHLVYRRLIPQGQNTLRLVTYFKDDGTKRLPITMDEFHVLFPENIDELVRIWLSLDWAVFFYIMATCGLRPGEVAAIDLSYWQPGVGMAVAQSVDTNTLEVKGLKTEDKGVVVKPAYFNDRTESMLTLMVYQGASQSGLLFTVNGRPIIRETSNKHFKASCRRAGIDPGKRTQYSLRHFYATEIAKHLDEKEAAEYLGQRVLRSEYDHRKVVERLKKNDRMRQVSNRIF